MMCCLVSDIQAAEAQNAYVKVSADTPVYRLEQKGDTDFDAYCGGAGHATFTVGALDGWELVAPSSGSVSIAVGGTGGWKVKSKLNEDKPEGTIYLWNYYIRADVYNAKNITVPFGKEVIYKSYEGENTTASDWLVMSAWKGNTSSIIFNRGFWGITEWFTESYTTPKPGVYGIHANLTGKPWVFDEGEMTVVGAEFNENESHPYGYDDYSNWSLDPTDYYGDRKGHCTLPYASVEEGHEGMVNLTVDPDSNTKAINLSSSAPVSKLALNPETTETTTDVGFTPASGWFPQTATVTAKMDDTSLAKLEVTSYDLRQYKCLLVPVCTVTNSGPGVHSSCSKFNEAFKQAVTEISTAKEYYLYSSVPVDYIWTDSTLNALKESFVRDNPALAKKHDFIMFFVEGTLNGNYRIAGAGERGGIYSVIFNEAALLDSVAPHELGHNFGLLDLYDVHVSGSDLENLMNNLGGKKLRKSQWQTIRKR